MGSNKAIIWMFGALALLATAFPASAGEAVDRLNTFYREVRTFTADFQQTLVDADGAVIQESAGTVSLERPDRFRWSYKEPYPQIVVGDGRRVWVYDSELDQVTVKSMKKAVGNAPAVVLSGERPLEEDFAITDEGRKDGLLWVRLQPYVPESDFRMVRIGFGEHLEVMELVDNFDQVTRIRFSDMQRNPSLDPGLFRFQVPEGVDVIGDAW